MQSLKASAVNFQSFESVEFDYSNLGLAGIFGPTGVGKSTLFDLPYWIAFGSTSKEGAADDVRTWDGEGVTKGVLTIDDSLVITRIRGGSTQNDLFWEEGGKTFRGKDLTETQKLLEQRLGVTADLFLTGAYLTQFSKADGFFIAKAKERREVLEQIADQSLAIQLTEAAQEARKASKKSIQELEKTDASYSTETRVLSEAIDSLTKQSETWVENQADAINEASAKDASFDKDKAKRVADVEMRLKGTPVLDDTQPKAILKELEAKLWTKDVAKEVHSAHAEATEATVTAKAGLATIAKQRDALGAKPKNCPTCKQPVTLKNLAAHKADMEAQESEHKDVVAWGEKQLTDLSAAIQEQAQFAIDIKNANDSISRAAQNVKDRKSLQEAVDRERAAVNPHKEMLGKLVAAADPYKSQIAATESKYHEAVGKMKAAYKKLEAERSKLSEIEWLIGAAGTLRALMLEKVVSQLTSATNAYLETYFDAPLRVELEIEGADKINATIFHNGHTAPFKQLSGGERGMLKLCFSIALMKAAQDRAGVQFGIIMLDEALNGLDDSLKVKAFNLLQKLESETPTVLVIDHCQDLKALFTTRFEVSNNGGHSVVEQHE